MSETDISQSQEDFKSLEVTEHDIALERAQMLIEGERWEQALAELQKALVAEPESPLARHLSGICYLYMGEYEKAKHEEKLALELYPDFDDAYWILANIALQQEKYSEGLKAIKVALEMDPSDAEYYVTKASLLLDSNKFQAALDATDEALKLEPENESAGGIRTLALSSLGRHDEAEIQAQNVMKSAPDDPLSWYQKGAQLFAQKRLDESRHALLESLRLDPENAEAEMMLMKVMSAQKGFFALFWRWTLFLLQYPPTTQRVIIIGLFLFTRIIRGIGQSNPKLAPITIPITVIWVLFCIYTWSAESLFKLSVRKGWIK